MAQSNQPTVRVHTSIAAVDCAAWAPLVDNQVFAQYGWLRTVEESVAEAASPTYFLLFDNSRLMAAAVCYQLDGGAGKSMLDRMLYGRLAESFSKLRLSVSPALLCGPVIGHGRYVFWAPELTFAQRGAYVGKLFSELERYCQLRALSLVFANIPPDEVDQLGKISKRMGSRSLNLPVSALDIRWSSFSEYVSSLAACGKNLPNKTRREVSALAKNDVDLVRDTRFHESGDKYLCLVEENLERHAGAVHRYAANLFHSLFAHHQDSSVVTVAKYQQETQGVALLLTADQSAAGPIIGVKKNSRNRRSFTYFNLAVYEPVRHCIRNGILRLYLGAGAYELKRRRGCHVLPLVMYVRCRSVTGRAAMRVWCWIHRVWTARSLRRQGVGVNASGRMA